MSRSARRSSTDRAAQPDLGGRPRRRGRRGWTALVVSVGATVLIVVAQASLSLRKPDAARPVEPEAVRTRSFGSDVWRASPPKRRAPRDGGSRVRSLEPSRDDATRPASSPTRESPAGVEPPAADPAQRPTSPPRVGPAIILASWDSGEAPSSPSAATAARREDRAYASSGPAEGGADEQRARLDDGYAAQELGQRALARGHFAAAASGRDERVRARARQELGASWLEEAYDRKALGDVGGATAAFLAAREAGVDPQLVDAELGYLAATRGRAAEARGHFSAAARGPDATIAGQAREELSVLPRHRWTEIYAEGFGWHRVAGVDPGGDFVPSTRVRFLYRPDLDLDLNLFAGLHLSRDFAWGAGLDAVPRTYAEGLILAAGVLFRTWEQRVSLFAQAGPALASSGAVDAERGLKLDVRAGATLALESAQCWPRPADGIELRWRPCADGWGELLYASRFERDVGLHVRGRAGGSFLVTGPLAWGVVAELRAAVDGEGALYGELAEVGAGMRVRLLAPLRTDVIVSVNRGRWLGLVRPSPDPTTYTDLRVLIATYLEL